MLRRFGYYDSLTIEDLGKRMFFEIFPLDRYYSVQHFDPIFFFILMNKLATVILGITGNALFITAVMIKIPKDRLRTLVYGAVAVAIMFIANLYGLFTFWKQSKWLSIKYILYKRKRKPINGTIYKYKTSKA